MFCYSVFLVGPRNDEILFLLEESLKIVKKRLKIDSEVVLTEMIGIKILVRHTLEILLSLREMSGGEEGSGVVLLGMGNGSRF